MTCGIPVLIGVEKDEQHGDDAYLGDTSRQRLEAADEHTRQEDNGGGHHAASDAYQHIAVVQFHDDICREGKARHLGPVDSQRGRMGRCRRIV